MCSPDDVIFRYWTLVTRMWLSNRIWKTLGAVVVAVLASIAYQQRTGPQLTIGTGPRTYVHARLADGSRLVAQTAGDTAIRQGDRAAFRFGAEDCHLFDAAGKRLGRPALRAGGQS